MFACMYVLYSCMYTYTHSWNLCIQMKNDSPKADNLASKYMENITR